MLKYAQWLSALSLVAICSCTKSSFLDKKPNTNIVVPKSLEDMTELLDNQTIMCYNSPASGILSADEYFYPTLDGYNAVYTKTEKNWYLWNKDIYSGELKVAEWNAPYQAIFYANVVLEAWDNLSPEDKTSEKGKFVKGWALFDRSYNYFNLAQSFCLPYNETTASNDLGVPLKVSADINDLQSRSNLKQTYDLIIDDLVKALELLKNTATSNKPNRPSSSAAYALMARIYLYMGDYKLALSAANNALSINDYLIDYNSIDATAYEPFTIYNREILYLSITNVNYVAVTVNTGFSPIDTALVNLYDMNDLRRAIYFMNDKGLYFMKNGYNGTGAFPFTGLAVDEIYLIKSEAQARANDLTGSLITLNFLLENRYKKGTFVPFQSSSKQDVLDAIINERRKELVWRGQRWQDIKRLNREGANITLKRVLGGTTYSLPPNDPRYVMPIPDDEIALSHIQQNER